MRYLSAAGVGVGTSVTVRSSGPCFGVVSMIVHRGYFVFQMVGIVVER